METRKYPVIAICNNKGGPTKTESVKRLAIQLAIMGHHVTVVDMDPQGNLTKRCNGLVQVNAHAGAVLGGATAATCRFTRAAQTVEVEKQMLDLIPADLSLENVALGLANRTFGRLSALADAIEMDRQLITGPIIIDTQPNIGALTLNAMVAADFVIVPAEPQEDSIAGVYNIIRTLAAIQKERDRAPVLLGTIAARVDERVSDHRNGLLALTSPRMPPLLGVVPARIGVDAAQRRNEAYAPIARLICELIGLEVNRA